METTSKPLKFSGVWLIAILLFFFNSALWQNLPLAILMTPLWLFFLHSWGTPLKELLITAVFFFLLFGAVHFSNGVVASYYFISDSLLFCIIIFTLTCSIAFRKKHEELDMIFRHLLVLNFLVVILSSLLFFTPSLRNTVWYTNFITPGLPPVARLKLFTTEASHYAYFFAPIAIYFLSRLLFFETRQPLLTLFLVAVPLILSFSLGVLLCIVISGSIIFLLYYRRIFSTRAKKGGFAIAVLALIIVAVLLYIFYPENPLYYRLSNLLNNKDSSARGRTYESFLIAHKIIAQKSFLFGVGPGQFKVIGRNVVLSFYQYANIPESVRLPNACADTLVCFGYIGLALRLLLQFLLFFKTKVFNNPFRVWLFIFLFVYQFTGSYITNTVEYLLWALAFAPVFPDFTKGQQANFKQ